MIKILVFKI